MEKVSAEDVAFYQENGYVLYHHPVFPAAMQDELRGIFEVHLAQKGDKLSDELDTPHFRDPRLLPFLLSEHVLDLVEPLIGPNIALWSSHFICKDPYTGGKTPWHEDSAFWQGRLSALDQIVTVWLAIDRSTKENGCMQVIPGTHLKENGFAEYVPTGRTRNFTKEMKGGVDEANAVLRIGAGRVFDARRPYRPRRHTQHQPPPALWLHDALLPHFGEDGPDSESRPSDLAGARPRPRRQHVRQRLSATALARRRSASPNAR